MRRRRPRARIPRPRADHCKSNYNRTLLFRRRGVPSPFIRVFMQPYLRELSYGDEIKTQQRSECFVSIEIAAITLCQTKNHNKII